MQEIEQPTPRQLASPRRAIAFPEYLGSARQEMIGNVPRRQDSHLNMIAASQPASHGVRSALRSVRLSEVGSVGASWRTQARLSVPM